MAAAKFKHSSTLGIPGANNSHLKVLKPDLKGKRSQRKHRKRQGLGFIVLV
jgi:hypothetical protein